MAPLLCGIQTSSVNEGLQHWGIFPTHPSKYTAIHKQTSTVCPLAREMAYNNHLLEGTSETKRPWKCIEVFWMAKRTLWTWSFQRNQSWPFGIICHLINVHWEIFFVNFTAHPSVFAIHSRESPHFVFLRLFFSLNTKSGINFTYWKEGMRENGWD